MAKHVAVAYALWLVGFWMGLHHLYLRRARAAFLHTVSLNMCGLGCWRDLLLMPMYVAEANGEHCMVVATSGNAAARSEAPSRPRIAWFVVLLQLVLAFFFGWIASSLLPEGSPAIAFEALFAAGAAWAIWFAGTALDLSVDSSLVRVSTVVVGVVLLAFAATGGDASNPIYEDARSAAVLLGCFVFWVSRTWSAVYRAAIDDDNRETALIDPLSTAAPEPTKPSSWSHTLALYYALLGAFSVALTTAIVFHGEVTITVNGHRRTYAFTEAAENVLRSEQLFEHFGDLFAELRRAADTHERARFAHSWRAFQDHIDVSGRKRHLRVLGLRAESSPSPAVIKRAYKQLALQWHPDKYAGEDAVHARKQFYAIQTAYEKLQALQSEQDATATSARRRSKASSSDEL